jgi:competence protein ComEA
MKKLAILLPLTLTAAEMPEGAGKPIVERACTACHGPNAMAGYRKTREDWDAVVRRMSGRTQISAAEIETVIGYLAGNFPKVEDATKLNVNKATAADIARVMGLTDEEAQAVVAYRERHGNFRAWGEMLVIYNVDGKKIQAAQDKITY